jgi:S-phase kinase-associated protein 1
MDGDEFTVERQKAACSSLLSGMFEDADTDENEPIVVPNVRSPVLAKVVDYMNAPTDETFCSKMAYPLLFEVILAANYLHIQPLLDLGCKAVADVFKGKTLEEARQAFAVTTELSAEEIELIRRENPWCVVAEKD